MAERDTLGVTDPRAPTVISAQTVPGNERALFAGALFADYRIVRMLGRGGMGEVYLAVDDRLRREIAIKVVRPGFAAGRNLLLREAQAMARLAHPNVVTVHECGLVDDQVFIAMEYVEGKTLRQWLAGAPPWAEVRRVFLAAGHGLAAAHDAGLVHRDFKPDNVLVGDDGRVRVGDFGLAAGVAEGDDAISAGTPAYMAPEQRDGGALDARCDQYAFATTLWEAIAGALPTEEPRRPLPAWLRAIVQRGREPRPDDRYPSMDALLAALGRDPALRRRRIAIGAGVIALGAVAVLGWARGAGHAAAPCAVDPHALDGRWDAAVAAAVRARFHASGRAYGDATADRVAAALDDYATDWRGARHDACTATAVRREQSEAVLDLRIQCLDRRAAELGALTALFAGDADAEVVDRAVQAVAALPRLDACADTATLAEVVPPPAGAETAIAALRARLDAADALLSAGRTDQALPLLLAIAAEARPIDYPQLHAEALRKLASAQLFAEKFDDSEATLVEALHEAARAHDDTSVAVVWRERIAIAEEHGQIEAGLALVAPTEAALVRIGSPPQLEGDMLVTVAQLRQAAHDYQGARRDAERALALYQQAGAQPIDRADALNVVAIARRAAGDYAGARRAGAEALAIWEQALGSDHPKVAGILMNLAGIDIETGDYPAAEQGLRRAIAIWEPTLGPEHGNVGRALGNLAQALRLQQRFPEAREAAERALAIKLAALGPDHPSIGNSLSSLGMIAFEENDLPAARDYWERALALRLRIAGPDDTTTAETLDLLGDLETREGHHPVARDHYQRALAIWRETNPAGHPLIARGLSSLTANDLATDRLDDAVAHGREALAILDANPDADPAAVAQILEMLGHALLRLHRYSDAREVLTRVVDLTTRLGAVHLDPLIDLAEASRGLHDDATALPLLEQAVTAASAHATEPGDAAYLLARARFALARTLWDSAAHRDRKRAVELATLAAADLNRADRDTIAPARRELSAWRAAHHP